VKPTFLSDTKNIHVEMNKELFLMLRAKLFMNELSVQKVFEEVARLIVAEDSRTEKIINELKVRLMHDKLQAELAKSSQTKPVTHMSELDHDKLYSLINRHTQGTQEDT
jgi:hypothetical protein